MVIASRQERIYSQFPEIASGYELNAEHGYFAVIIPEATTNLIINPSGEAGNTNFYAAAPNGAMVGITTWQAYGAYGIQLTPAVSLESGCRYGTVSLTSGTTYTFSIVMQGEEGKTYYVWFSTNAGALIGTKRKWIGTGHKQRIWVTYTETSSTTRYLNFTRDAQYADQNLFYTDAWQLEAKSYPTTYCDGDQVGFVLGEVAYSWNGTPRASTSTRSALTRAGGREVNLLDLGIRILAILGLGMAPLVDQALPMPGRGELAQGTGTQAREFTLVGALYGEGSAGRHLQALRSGLIDAFKPDLTPSEQPMILRYQACDEEGNPTSDSLDIICKYQNGLEGNWDNHQQERLALNFKMHLPLIQNTYDSGADLGYAQAIADANYGVYRDENGTWHNLSANFNNDIRAIVTINDRTYFGGVFSNFGGDASKQYLAYFDWNLNTVVGISDITGGTGIYALAVDPAGNLTIGGNFTAIGGDADYKRLASFDGTNFIKIGTGIASGSVQALTYRPDGALFVGGTFTNHANADGDYITMYLGGNWYSPGPADDAVFALATNKFGHIYVGGQFTTFAGQASNGLMILDWFTGGVFNVTDQFTAGNVIYALSIDDAGNLMIGGALAVADFATTMNLAQWNGTSLTVIDYHPGNTYAIQYYQGYFYVGGNFTQIGTLPLALGDRLGRMKMNTVPLPRGGLRGRWGTGGNWAPVDINLPGTPTIYALHVAKNRLFIGYSTAGTAYANVVDVQNNGTSEAYPYFVFTGPGTIWQCRNFTTKQEIFFDLTFQPGESAILDLNPIHPGFVSTFRGNIWNAVILQGSELNMKLMPGSNYLSVFMYGQTSGTTRVGAAWRNQYWSLDGAVWK